jgi:hypothetical protein
MERGNTNWLRKKSESEARKHGKGIYTEDIWKVFNGGKRRTIVK